DDLAGAVAMRMGVLLGRTSVRRPAGVADAVITGDRIGADNLFQVRQFAGAAAQIDRAVADHGDSRRVVAAIFEPPQAVDENRHDVLRSDVADNSTHRVSSRAWPKAESREPKAYRFTVAPSRSFFFLSTHPSRFRCFPALTASAFGGTSSRTVVPLPT